MGWPSFRFHVAKCKASTTTTMKRWRRTNQPTDVVVLYLYNISKRKYYEYMTNLPTYYKRTCIYLVCSMFIVWILFLLVNFINIGLIVAVEIYQVDLSRIIKYACIMNISIRFDRYEKKTAVNVFVIVQNVRLVYHSGQFQYSRCTVMHF